MRESRAGTDGLKACKEQRVSQIASQGFSGPRMEGEDTELHLIRGGGSEGVSSPGGGWAITEKAANGLCH